MLTLDGSSRDLALNGRLKINTFHDGSVYFERDGGSDFSIEHDTSQIYWYNRTINKNVPLLKNIITPKLKN